MCAADDDFKTSPALKAFRAELALSGNMLGGPAAIKEALIDFLLSDAVISPTIRGLLADALLHGGIRKEKGSLEGRRNSEGYPIPSLTVEGLGDDGKLGSQILKRREWFDRGEEVELEIAANIGRKGNVGKAYETVLSRPHVLGDRKYLELTCRPFYLTYLRHRDSASMRAACLERFGIELREGDDFGLYDDLSRTIFIEDKARDGNSWP